MILHPTRALNKILDDFPAAILYRCVDRHRSKIKRTLLIYILAGRNARSYCFYVIILNRSNKPFVSIFWAQTTDIFSWAFKRHGTYFIWLDELLYSMVLCPKMYKCEWWITFCYKRKQRAQHDMHFKMGLIWNRTRFDALTFRYFFQNLLHVIETLQTTPLK